MNGAHTMQGDRPYADIKKLKALISGLDDEIQKLKARIADLDDAIRKVVQGHQQEIKS